jgi:hypothetical protein
MVRKQKIWGIRKGARDRTEGRTKRHRKETEIRG